MPQYDHKQTSKFNDLYEQKGMGVEPGIELLRIYEYELIEPAEI